MSEITVVIVNGEATVTADGTKVSCAAAVAVEKAIGQTTKTTPTGMKPMSQQVKQG